MKQFRFRLETLLRFRVLQEEQAQLALVQATVRLRQAQDKLQNMKDKFTTNTNVLRECQQKGVNIEILKQYSDYLDKIKRDIAGQESAVAQANAERQEKLRILEEAMKQRKLVENLKAKRRMQYNIEALQEEQKLLDEMGIQIYLREK